MQAGVFLPSNAIDLRPFRAKHVLLIFVSSLPFPEEGRRKWSVTFSYEEGLKKCKYINFEVFEASWVISWEVISNM